MAGEQKAFKNAKLSFRKLSNKRSLSPKTELNPRELDSDENRKRLYQEACMHLKEVMQAVRERQPFTLLSGFDIVQRMVACDKPQDPLFFLALHLDDVQRYIVHHSVNVAVFCIKIAEYLNYTTTQSVEIGMAGLVHEIGMARVPDRLLYKKSRLSEREIRVLKKGIQQSTTILMAFKHEWPYLAEVTAQIHERVDGSGFPRGLKAGEIHEYAQIIGLLHKYESLIHSRPQRGKRTPFAAVKEIIRSSKTRFEHKYLKALLNVFTVFPVQSYVRLNSNAIGRVIETYPDYPLRPKLKLAFDSQKRKVLTEQILDLQENPLLHIVDAVSDAEVKQLAPV
jgi:HD-GYP domain-containing protein (c-di-GMP phosphodiesterase class II)